MHLTARTRAEMEAITAVDPPYLLVSNQDDQKATECPDYIANASERDRKMMSVPDSQYHRMSWDEVQWVISKIFMRITN